MSANVLLAPETLTEAAEEAAFVGQRRRRPGRLTALGGDGLVIIRTRDRVDDLALSEILGAGNHGHKTDEYAIAHHLCLETRRTIRVPDRLPKVRQGDTHSELADIRPLEVSRNATIPKRVHYPLGPVLVHQTKVALDPV